MSRIKKGDVVTVRWGRDKGRQFHVAGAIFFTSFHQRGDTYV